MPAATSSTTAMSTTTSLDEVESELLCSTGITMQAGNTHEILHSSAPRYHKQSLRACRSSPRFSGRCDITGHASRNVNGIPISSSLRSQNLTRKLFDSSQLLSNLTTLSRSARHLPVSLPLEIIQYVESARNPDIYTREFVELVMRYNQQLSGRSTALAQFRDILAREIAGAIPEMEGVVAEVVGATKDGESAEASLR
jgi:mediator of RNA polymerase II transcription subunit 10